MSYLDVYIARMNNFGDNAADRAVNQGKHYFDQMLQRSPQKRTATLFNNSALSESVVFFYNRARDMDDVFDVLTYSSSYFTTGNTIAIDGNYYILGRLANPTIVTHNHYLTLPCNQLVKYSTKYGEIKTIPVHVVDAVVSHKYNTVFVGRQSIIAGITDQGMNLILSPEIDIEPGYQFYIGDLTWQVNAIDKISINGVYFVSLTEQKNAISSESSSYINVASNWEIDLNIPTGISLSENSQTNLTSFVYKDYSSSDSIVNYQTNSSNLFVSSNILYAINAGDYNLYANLVESSNIVTTINVKVETTPSQTIYNFIGPDKIKGGQFGEYTLYKYVDGLSVSSSAILEFSSQLISLASSYANQYLIEANNDAEFGSCALNIYDGSTLISKTIEVIVPWS